METVNYKTRNVRVKQVLILAKYLYIIILERLLSLVFFVGSNCGTLGRVN